MACSSDNLVMTRQELALVSQKKNIYIERKFLRLDTDFPQTAPIPSTVQSVQTAIVPSYSQRVAHENWLTCPVTKIRTSAAGA